jgi:C-terminal processing protease CtpA/Prc
MKTLSFITVLVFSIILTNTVVSQTNSDLNQQIKKETIDKLSIMLKDYIYPEVGLKVSTELNKNIKDGKYNRIKNFREFGQVVTKDMFKISNDKHLLIRYEPEDVNEIKQGEALSGKEKDEYTNQQKEKSAKRNFGFKEVKILPGNIGYLKLNEFERANFASGTAYAAMEFISNSDAIIIDLRNNNGGWGSMVQTLCSYFFSADKKIQLFETHYQYKNEIIQSHTLPYLPGKRMPEIPLYILTGKRTYSAAENFTDILQKRNRATIIGEITRGGANSTRGPEVLNNYYIVKMPVGETINSITKKNWEGVGVKPDIPIESKLAFNRAIKIILSNQIKQNSNEGYVNSIGYSLLNENMFELAIFVFKENVKNHDKSANCYDSLGEAYMLNSEYKLAVKNYKRSLELDPNNENAKQMIKRIENEK